jgi:hypothetical protein
MFGLQVFLVLIHFVRVLVLRGEIYSKASCNFNYLILFNPPNCMLLIELNTAGENTEVDNSIVLNAYRTKQNA